MGRGGGQVVSMLSFYSDDPSSNPVKPTVISVKFVFDKSENNPKEAGTGPFKKYCRYYFFAKFKKGLATFYCNIWSHCFEYLPTA